MKLPFTKMQGAGNDFVVLDATRSPIALDRAQWRWLADRRFGIGADQILIVGPPADPSRADFSYRIFNADGGEVEQCGNGARCFARFVRDQGLTAKDEIRVETLAGLITPPSVCTRIASLAVRPWSRTKRAKQRAPLPHCSTSAPSALWITYSKSIPGAGDGRTVRI